ncbi:DUF992 domain-containing protein [Aestuariivirga sp.]|jgi:hypothetical protein|uniref:DUF992 domain-containing protein n=1 Tax=Aestuariivirga sp. TaxID=2650926 RepID=UPI003782EFFD
MKKTVFAALIALGLAASPALAASKGVKIGVLTCDVAGGVGMIIGSSKAVDCSFEGTIGKREHYKGSIDKLGLDIGVTGKGVMAWAVFAPGKLKAGALAGHYVGASAEASVAVGLGANVLVGGSDKSIALQPLSVQAQTGLNLAAGVASLRLKKAK